MSAGEQKFVSTDSVKSCGIIKTDQHNGKRSFIVSVDGNGKIEVSPNSQCNEVRNQSKVKHEPRKATRAGKQRIRIALIEEDAGSSDEEQDTGEDRHDMISIDAQSFEAMHDRFFKIYNKNLRGKPSFVVLEDALVRKRMEQSQHHHCNPTTCHCHAQQQTSPCDIGAHTGSQTDEFLLQCALRSQMHLKGQSRGCQATDVNVELQRCSHCNGNINKHKSLHVPTLRRLSHIRALQLADNCNKQVSNQPTLAEITATPDIAPRVTISFMPQNTPQLAQQQEQPMLSTTATAHSNYQQQTPNCACNNCCLQSPAQSNSNYCLQATDNYACFYKPQTRQQQQQQSQQQQQQQQQQQLPLPQQYQQAPQQYQQTQLTMPQQQQQAQLPLPQQQYQGPATAYNNCCSSCCLLRPTMAQTSLGFNHPPIMTSHISQQMLLSPELSMLPQRLQPQEYPMTTWQPPQAINPCLCYPLSTYNMATFGIPPYASCQLQPQQYGVRYNEQQQYVDSSSMYSRYDRSPRHADDSEPQSKLQIRRERAKKKSTLNSKDQQLDLQSSGSQVTVKRMTAPNEKLSKKAVPQHARNKAGAAISPTTKLFMARFGRTCLILKPTASSMPSRLLSKRINRFTSVMSWPRKMPQKLN